MSGLEELNSFVGKFVRLWQTGVESSLHLSSQGGKAFINLQAGLGQAPPIHPSLHHTRLVFLVEIEEPRLTKQLVKLLQLHK